MGKPEIAKKLGLIAGGGALPHLTVKGARAQGYEIYVAALKGEAEMSAFDAEGGVFAITELGRVLKTFKRKNCTHVCMAGTANRPDFKSLKPDVSSLKYLPGAVKAAGKGDDALLKFLVSIFEKEGFEILAPQDLCGASLMPSGVLGAVSPGAQDEADIAKAREIAAQIGRLDIGQGAVVCAGLVLAVEAQEGTDAMLRRVASLDGAVRGAENARAGVLAKRLKPGQEARVDLPTIGVTTVDLAAKAGLAGIAVEAGQAFIIDIDAVKARADDLGVFVIGVDVGVESDGNGNA